MFGDILNCCPTAKLSIYTRRRIPSAKPAKPANPLADRFADRFAASPLRFARDELNYHRKQQTRLSHRGERQIHGGLWQDGL